MAGADEHVCFYLDEGKFSGFYDEYFDAILEDDLRKVKSGISKGFTGLSKSSNGDMALHFTCLNSKLEILRLLKKTLKDNEIDTINIEADDTICGTALHMSMDGQVCVEVVEMLLEWGANPNATDAKGSTVLHELIYRAWEDFGEHFESEERMWEDDEIEPDEDCAVDTDSTIYSRISKNGKEGPEHSTCREDKVIATGESYIHKLTLLRKYGADMNMVNSGTGLSPLHFWFQNFNWSMESFTNSSLSDWCIKFLENFLELGADISAVNDRGETAFTFLTQRHYKPCHAEFMQSYRTFLRNIICRMTEADIKKRDVFGRTLLHCAVEHSNCVFVEELLNVDTDVNAQDKFGLSGMHIITHNLALDETEFVQSIISSLMSNGGNINLQDNHGASPLHHAVVLNNHSAIQILLEHGASREIEDKLNRNSNSVSELYGDPITQFLLEVSSLEKSLHTDIASTGLTSNDRYGWYFPMCCHKKYTLEHRRSEEHEKVKVTEIKTWLEKYPMCIHNSGFVLRNSISAFGSNSEQIQCDETDAKQIREELYKMAFKLAEEVGNINPLFQSHVIFGGSTSEGTKVGACDEFDFVFDLFKIREAVLVEESEETLAGFVTLKVTDREIFAKFDSTELIDDNGHLKRSETSKMFHKYLERAMNAQTVWKDNSFLSFWGTTNALGECFNIGQLQLIWYGPSLKRQDINVDIAPVVRVPGWQSRHFNKDSQIIDKDVAYAVGCYLMMKDPMPYLEKNNIFDGGDDELDSTYIDSLFKVSVSQVEHASMKFLPGQIKNGYSLAKSIQLQCPHILFNLFESLTASKDVARETFADKDGTLRGVVPVWEYLTSYVIKTGLFRELHASDIRLNCTISDFDIENWNRRVLQSPMFDTGCPSKDEFLEAVQWALRIYRRILVLISEKKKLQEYYLPPLEATKMPGGSEPFVKIIKVFLETVIYLLEHLKIPDDILRD